MPIQKHWDSPAQPNKSTDIDWIVGCAGFTLVIVVFFLIFSTR